MGYKSTELVKDKYTALAVQFENVDQTEIPVKDLISITGSFTTGKTVDEGGDQIWKWDPNASGWIKYYYRGGRGVDAALVGWTKDGEDKITTETIKAGEVVFFKLAGDTTTATLSGAVKPFTGSVNTTCVKDMYTYLAYPWPVAMKIKDFGNYLDGEFVTGKTVDEGGDQIWVWDSNKSDWIKYYYRGGRGVDAALVGWTKDGEDSPTEESIDPGVGFFFKRAGDTAVVTFTYDK